MKLTITSKIATLCGIFAIILWSLNLALTRSLAESLGPLGAGAAIYIISGLLVWTLYGKVSLRQQNRLYLWGCGSLFVTYMVAFTLAIGLAHSRTQTLEIGLVNYLWPSLTIVFAVYLLKLNVRWWLWLGVCIAFLGIVWVVAGSNDELSIASFFANLQSNPTAYGLVALAAVAWSLYSNLLRLYCHNKGALPLFLLASGISLWVMYLCSEQASFVLTQAALFELLFISVATAVSYLCWDLAMQKGHATLLATLSYFTPLLSITIACFWLDTQPPNSLWSGIILVITGSLLCWSACRRA